MAEPSPPDLELLERWRAGDQGAAQELMKRHYTSVLRLFELKATAVADDLTQRTFLACVEGRERFRGEGSFKGYLFGIARFTLLEHLRRSNRGERLVRFGDDDEPRGPDVTRLSTVVARQQEQQLLLRALVDLPPDMYMVLQLYYWEELPTAQIGHALGVPKSTVTTRLARARARLEERLVAMTRPGPVRDGLLGNLDGWARSLSAPPR